MIRKSHHSASKSSYPCLPKENKLELEDDDKFELRPINPMVFLLDREKKFAQNDNPKI